MFTSYTSYILVNFVLWCYGLDIVYLSKVHVLDGWPQCGSIEGWRL
jgi:hypothetical protein